MSSYWTPDSYDKQTSKVTTQEEWEYKNGKKTVCFIEEETTYNEISGHVHRGLTASAHIP